MLTVINAGGESVEQRHRTAGALFRLVSDDYAFLTSALGDQLVDLMNDYAGWPPA
jgi:hypothetical protein